MGNSAKIAGIALGIKKSGAECGTSNIFVFFGNNYYEYCYTEKIASEVGGALTVAKASEIITDMSQHAKSIYFCGAQPLARHDWIARLYEDKPILPCKIITNNPDAKALAKILPVIDSVELHLVPNFTLEELLIWRKFIMLANLKNITLQVKVSDDSLSEFAKFIIMVKEIDNEIAVLLDSGGNFTCLTEHYNLAANCLKNVQAVNKAVFEVD